VSVLDVGAPRDDAPDAVAITGHQWPVSDPVLRMAPDRESYGAAAVRHALLWQRWVRFGAAGLVLASALLVHYGWVAGGSGNWTDGAPLAAVGLCYSALTLLIAWFVGAASDGSLPPGLPAVVLAGDLAAIIGVAVLSSPPADYDRMLLLGLFAVQLTMFSIGRQLAAWAYAFIALAYVAFSLFVPPYIAGDPRPPGAVALEAATFLFAGGVLLYAFGDLRERLHAIRRFCRDVEVGELGGTLEPIVERRTDDLTLLARSIDEMRARLIELIGTDPLTECLNRRAFETRLTREWRQAVRRGTPLAVLAIDIDRFKPINDGFGHPFGDSVLQAVARILKATVRETDVVARPGGDEFVLILPDTGWQGATTFAERLRANVDEHRFGVDTTTETTLDVTISVGVAVMRGSTDSNTPEAVRIGPRMVGPVQLLEEADRSLYRAKSAGRNRISA
jgi:diguanylate cyclase (GGDEF)-like protein